MTRPRDVVVPAMLLALAGAGQAAALSLMDVRRYAVYSHYVDWPALAAASPVALGVIGIQVLVCGVLAWRRRDAIRRGILAIVPGWRLPALGALVVAGAAVPTVSAMRFARETLLATTMVALGGTTLGLAALHAPADLLSRWRAWLATRVTLEDGRPARAWDRAIPIVLAAFAATAALAVSLFVLDGLPHIDDSVSYLFQARIMAGGHLSVPAPPDSASFQMDEVVIDGSRWYGYAFPGWPALLALGTVLGAPWIVNPLLAGAAVLLAHRLMARVYGRGTANAVAVLLALSTWSLFMSAEMLTHPLSLVVTLAALLALDLEPDQPGVVRGSVAGAALGVLALTRPFDAVLVLPVAVGWAVRTGGWRAAIRQLAAAGVVALLVASLILPYDTALTGHPLLTPHNAWTDRRWGPGVDRIGFGPDVGIPAWRNLDPLPGHGPADVALNLNKNLFSAGIDLFGWTCGSTVFVWLFLLRGQRRRGDGLMLSLAAVFVVGYSFYWFSGGPDPGPRYWYPALVALVTLTVSGARSVACALGGRSALRVSLFIAAATAFAWATFVPSQIVRKYHRYRDVSADARRLAGTNDFGRALVFVRSPLRADYQGPFSLNDPWLSGAKPVYAHDVDAAHRAAVERAFPDRPVWTVGRNAPGEPLRILERPRAPGAASPRGSGLSVRRAGR